MFSMLKRLTASVLLLALLLPIGASAAEFAPSPAWRHFAALEAQWLSGLEAFPEPPQYYQTDYPDTPYGHGTIATSGCGITCLAMAASYLLDQKITPEQLAEQFGELPMNNVQRIHHAVDVLDLPLQVSPRKWSQMRAALQNGQIVILLVNEQSQLTDGQHMVLLTGITDDGRILVQDPYEPNQYRPELLTGYAIGFQEETISEGFDGGWIFEKKDLSDAPDYATPFQNLRSMDWLSP